MNMEKNASGLYVPAPPAPVAYALGAEPQWNNHRRINQVRIGQYGARFGGGVQFADHIDNHLSANLWRDVVHRLCVETLWVIGPNQEEHEPPFGKHATVYVDENDVVTDICLSGF